MKWLVVGLAAACGHAAPAPGSRPPGPSLVGHGSGTLQGVVNMAGGGRVPLAEIYVAGDPNPSITDEKGEFKLDSIPPGEYEVRAQISGMKAGKRVTVPANGVGRANFVLPEGDMCSLGADASLNMVGTCPLRPVALKNVTVFGLGCHHGGDVLYVVAGRCIGDPRLNSAKFLHELGWEKAKPNDRERLALAWATEVLHAWSKKLDAASFDFPTEAPAFSPPKIETTAEGVIVIQAWEKEPCPFQSCSGERRDFVYREWRFSGDGDLLAERVADGPFKGSQPD